MFDIDEDTKEEEIKEYFCSNCDQKFSKDKQLTIEFVHKDGTKDIIKANKAPKVVAKPANAEKSKPMNMTSNSTILFT